MLHFEFAWLPLCAVALANFIFSWIWYSPLLFGKPFMKAAGIAPGHKMTEAEKKKMPLLMANGLFCSFLLSGALQILCQSLGASAFAQGALVGLLAWLGFALTGSLGTLWEGRAMTLVYLNNGLLIVTYAAFGGILAAWH